MDITPGLGAAMAGYRRMRRARGVHDPLHAKALVLCDGIRHVALVALDLCCVCARHVAEARRLINERCGIAPDGVMCWATHTHTGPVTDENIPPGEPDAEYVEALPGKIAESVALAQGRMRPARLGWAVGRAQGISFNRRALYRGRSLAPGANELLALLTDTGPRAPAPMDRQEWDKKAAKIDDEMGVLYVEGSDAKAVAVMVNFALHCDTVGGDLISAGYPHYLSRGVKEGAAGEAAVLFAPGACGDINHVPGPWAATEGADACFTDGGRTGKRKSAREIGGSLARQTNAALDGMSVKPDVSLAAARRQIVLRSREVSPQELRAAQDVMRRTRPDQDVRQRYYAQEVLNVAAGTGEVKTEVHLVTADDLAVVGLPGEVFVELGLEIKRRSPFQTTFVVGLANDYVGYVPTPQAFSEGGYEVMTASSSRLAGEAGRIMVEEVCTLLERLVRDQNR